MNLGPQLSWDACFSPGPFGLPTAYSFPDSNVDQVFDSLTLDSFTVYDPSARTFGLETPADGSRMSRSSTACEDGLPNSLDKKSIPVGADPLPKSPGLTSTASAACVYPFHMDPETPGGVARMAQQRHSLSRTSTPAIMPRKLHDRKVRRKRSPIPSRRPSSEINPRVRAAHSVVERRYRDKLNDKMIQLHLALASSKWMSPCFEESIVPEDISRIVGKIGKAAIMTNAINYVNQAEQQLLHMSNEVEQLRSRVLHLETLLPQSQSFRSHLLAVF